MTSRLGSIAANVASRTREFIEDLRMLVAVDSGSRSQAGVNEVAARCEAWLRSDGWDVERVRLDESLHLGDLVVARLHGSGRRRVLLLGHTDTVFPDGTAALRPLRLEGQRALGPGACDMKGGLVLGIWAVRWLRRQGFEDFAQITFLMNPDEELGSFGSRGLILDEARRHDVAFVLEAARASGAIVSSRKGLATIRIRVIGRAAHAGVEPRKGRSAVLAASRLVVDLHGLNGRWPSTTINVGTIRGGTHTNVVPEEATIELEVRAFSGSHLREAEHEIERLAQSLGTDGVHADVTVNREAPPMERTDDTVRLVERAKSIATELGFELNDEATGGASDGNTIAAAGVPTLDGLGPVGGDDHSEREWIDVGSIGQRAALLAGLISQAEPAAMTPT